MRLWSYCLAALLFDWVLYVLLTAVPMHASDLGADPLELALLQAVSSVVYVVMAIVMGRVADRVSKSLLARIGCVLMIAACLLVARTGTYLQIVLLMPLVGLTGTFFWPSIQGAIGQEARGAGLARDIGLFNIFWSLGKSIGFVTAGSMKGSVGTAGTLMAAAAGAGVVLLMYPPGRAAGEARRGSMPPDHPERSVFLRMSWVMNFVGFGVGATIGNQYIKLCKEGPIHLGMGRDPAEHFFGLLLFGIFLSQTAMFVALRHWNGWAYRRAPLYLAQVTLAAGCALLSFAGVAWVALLATPLIGAGLGFAYVASIYYSLHTSEGHGKYSGMHEAILGSGNFLLPLAAGALATGLGDLRWPYWVCAGAALIAIALQEGMYRRSRRLPVTASRPGSP